METKNQTITREKNVDEIIGKEGARNLQNEIFDALGDGAGYDDIEELMLDYGLEMDYIFDLLY